MGRVAINSGPAVNGLEAEAVAVEFAVEHGHVGCVEQMLDMGQYVIGVGLTLAGEKADARQPHGPDAI